MIRGNLYHGACGRDRVAREIFAYMVCRTRKFARGWGVFTWTEKVRVLTRKGLGMARDLQSYGQWGRRAEDPFRGLRAGPVRFLPFYLPAEMAIRRSPGKLPPIKINLQLSP